MVGRHRLLDHDASIFRCHDALELPLDLWDSAVGELARALVVTFALGMIELGLELVGLQNPILLGLPPCRQIGGVLFERDQLLLEPLEPLLRTWIALSPECPLLHLEPHDLTVDRIQRLRFGINLYLEPR